MGHPVVRTSCKHAPKEIQLWRRGQAGGEPEEIVLNETRKHSERDFSRLILGEEDLNLTPGIYRWGLKSVFSRSLWYPQNQNRELSKSSNSELMNCFLSILFGSYPGLLPKSTQFWSSTTQIRQKTWFSVPQDPDPIQFYLASETAGRLRNSALVTLLRAHAT